MKFAEELKCEIKPTEKQKRVDAYIEYVNSQGKNFLEFVNILNECITIAQKFELLGNVKIKARIKDFESTSRNTENKAVDDMFGVEIIPTTERDKEWIMLFTELLLNIGKNKRIEKSNGYNADNQYVSLKNNDEFDFSYDNVKKIISNSTVNVKRDNDQIEANKYPILKSQLENDENLTFGSIENEAILQMMQILNNFRTAIKFYDEGFFMPIVEMQIKTLSVAENAIRGTARHSAYKKDSGMDEKSYEERIKQLYRIGYLKMGINTPIKFDCIDGKVKLQNFEQTLLEMWPCLREDIVQDRISKNKNRIYQKNIKDLMILYPFLGNRNTKIENEEEAKKRLKLLMLNTDMYNVDVNELLKLTKRRVKFMKRPELLAPAGSFEKAKTAFLYGADSVYMGTSDLSLRSRVEVSNEELIKTIEYAHSINKKVHTALNIYARDNMYEEIEKQIMILKEAKVDALIISDGGIVEMARKLAPEIPIHISTQANVTSYHTGEFWKKNGAKRIILARELNKEEIKKIRENTDLEVEIFAHGAICYSYSGRCNLSDFLASRCGNLGDCAQSCRWAYNIYLEEKNKPGNLMPVEEDKNGTYILSSKDLCLIKEIPEIIEMDIDSLKIEGRLKTEYYLATVINAYRNAIDDYIKNPKDYDYTKYLKELEKTKTRGLTTFYFNDKCNKDFQEYDGKQYNPNYEFGGKIVELRENNKNVIEIRNRLQLGDTLEILIPNQLESTKFIIEEMYDIDTEEKITHVNPGKEGQKVILKIPCKTEKNWILRRKKYIEI